MNVKMDIVVLYVNPYHMEDMDEKTGEVKVNEGISVNFIYGTDMNPVVNSNGSQGQRPAKASLPTSCHGMFTCVPGLYTGIFRQDIDSKGKIIMRLDSAEFESKLSLSPVKAGVK